MRTSRAPRILWFVLLGVISTSFAQGDNAEIWLGYGWHFKTPYTMEVFPELPRSWGMLGDTLTAPLGLVTTNFHKIERTATISEDWERITITETCNGKINTMPVTAPLDWYMAGMKERQGRNEFIRTMQGGKPHEEKEATSNRKSDALELVGVDVGNLGRVALRVRGNVNISGKMVFQDQQLLASNYGETQNTHIEFDQKQNLNIEGKIGDRITVLMDQDSERDFDWENNIRVTYDGEEDEIVQKIEAGNISLSLPATQYVTFSGKNQGLFGLKAISKLGPVDITTIASVEQTRKEKQEYKGSSEATTQNIKDYSYRKNQYFFIHPWFRDGAPQNPADDVDTTIVVGGETHTLKIFPFYPLSYDGRHKLGNVTVVDFELYQAVNTSTPGSSIGIAHYDLDHPDANESATYVFDRMEEGEDYTLSENFGYIRLTVPSDDAVLGCTFKLVDANGDTVKTFGTIPAEEDTFKLQLLKYKTNNPSAATWDLMWKNVYYLGTTNIKTDGFAVRIYNNDGTYASERDSLGTNYLHLFGLDRRDENGNATPDELIDYGDVPNVNLVSGELIFPTFHPFVHSSDDEDGTDTEQLKGQLTDGIMYSSTNTNDIYSDSKYYIEVDYTNTSSNISLGFMVVEGSEEVKVGGVTKTRNIDYQIDYFTGTLTFLMDPTELANADVEVLFEKHELVSFDKKTIIGTRAQMDFGKNSFIGATALYYNQSVLNEKIEVGYEPTRNFIWDVNGRYSTELASLTRFIDRLPLLETEKMSSFSMEGEFAQVLPNPNPVNNSATGDDNGVAYIDDFEGAKRTTAPQILRRYWKASSAPLDSTTGAPYSQRNRADFYWYNPFTPMATTSIWPNLSTSTMAGNETTDILILKMDHKGYQSPDSLIWAGVTTPLYSGDYDQTDSKFFEIWLKPDNDDAANMNFTIDMGRISEDWNDDGTLNTEDVPEEGTGLDYGNGLLDKGEDTGIDGCEDNYEDGWCGCLPDTGLTFSELLAAGETELINVFADPDDPNGDNFKTYNSSHTDPGGINGTEGNENDASGIYPDTEDLDGSGFLDKTNDYFTKTISLDPNSVDATDYSGGNTSTGWKLYRIPLSHFSKIDTTGGITWDDIRHIRLSITGDDDDMTLRIAKIELVGNEWQELGIMAGDTTIYTDDDSAFAITVVNTEDNDDYDPPKGVRGEYDQINDIYSKEQSLVMQFNNLLPGYSGVAEKTLLELSGDKAQSYLTYDYMKMYVYGASDLIGVDTTGIEFFMQFGRSDDYYEIRQPVYNGWDENADFNRNSVKIDLNWLTSLKLADSSSIELLNGGDVFTDSTNLKRYEFSSNSGKQSNKTISIFGDPSLSRIQFIRMGIRNRSDLPATGEVWVDELRLSGVKKDRGVAMRVQTDLTLADFGKVTVAYSKKDADFHVLQDRLGSNNTSEDLRVNAALSMSKFLPKAWGLKVPFSTSFSNSTQTPKYHPGTDILVNKNAVPDTIMTKSNSVSFSTSIAKSSKSDRRLIKYTLDNISTSFSAKRSESSNYTTASNVSENYSGKIGYSIPFGKDNYISPFKWLDVIPLVGAKLSEFHLYYTPESFNANMNFSESLNQKQPRVGNKTETYNLGLTRNYSVSYKMTESIKKIQYSRNMASDLDHYRGYAWMAIRDLDPGTLTSSSENFSVAYTPAMLQWLNPSMNYSANYGWSKPLSSSVNGANIGTNLKYTTTMTLSPTKLVELVYQPPKKSGGPGSRARGGRVRDPNAGEPRPEGTSEPKKKSSFMNRVHTLSKNINPISLRYSSSLNRTGNYVIGTVPTGYKFGWLPEHGLEHDPSVGTNTGNWNYGQDYALSSGIKFSNALTTTLSYSQSTTQKRAGSGVETMSLNRDVFPYGKHLGKTIPLPGWSLRWTGLQKLPLIKKVANNVSLDHGFRGSEVFSWQFDSDSPGAIPIWSPGEFINENEEFERSAKYSSSFSPLVGLTMSFTKGITTNARLNYSRSLDTKSSGKTLKTDQSLTSSANYSHKGGLSIPIPFMKDFEIQNNINFTLNFDYTDSETKINNAGAKKFSITKDDTSWKVGLRISYSFTSRVSGGIVYEYRETDYKKSTGLKIDRDFGFDVNISISG